MGAIASQITSLTIVYSTVYSDADQRKHQSSASLAFVRGIHRWPVNSPHKWLVTRKMFPFDDVIMLYCTHHRNGKGRIWPGSELPMYNPYPALTGGLRGAYNAPFGEITTIYRGCSIVHLYDSRKLLRVSLSIFPFLPSCPQHFIMLYIHQGWGAVFDLS